MNAQLCGMFQSKRKVRSDRELYWFAQLPHDIEITLDRIVVHLKW